jgi:hypothetical protein
MMVRQAVGDREIDREGEREIVSRLPTRPLGLG